MHTLVPTSIPRAARRRARRTALARWLGRGLETHVSLPLFALLLVAALWAAAFHTIGAAEQAAREAAQDATRELVDTYEAQMARSLSGIDQTLRVLQYAVETNGPGAALGAMSAKGLLPPGLVFQVALVSDSGRVLASNPGTHTGGDVTRARWFAWHRDHPDDLPFVSETIGRREPHVVFSRRISDAAGRFAGVATVAVDPAYFTSSYERSRQGERGLLGLAGSDGVVRAVRVGEFVSWGQRLAMGGSDGVQLGASPTDGELRYTSTRALNGFPLVAVAGLSEAEQMAGFRQQRRAWLLGASAGTALLLLVVAFVSAWSWQLAKARRRERLAQQTYAAASEASLDAFFVLRTMRDAGGAVCDFLIEDTNTRAEQLTGLSRARMEGKPMSVMLPTYFSMGIFADLAAVATDGVAREAEWQSQLLPVAERWLHRQVVPVEGGVVAIVRDITERKLAEQRIRHLAHHDDLTGLPNRSLLRDRLGQAIRDAERKGKSVGLAFIDLDGFKLVNDGLGHNAGDELLKVVGERMGRCLRRNDTLARFGGDEFVILLPDLSGDPMAITPLLEKVRQAVTEPVEVEGQEVQVSCSMGVVLYPRDGGDANTLMMNADAAMYRAKENKDSFQFYASEMNASVEEKLVLLEGMRSALESCTDSQDCGGAACQFHLLYQPKIDLRSGRLFGVEALIRWNHPEHGLISPLRFIGLAEESGMIVALGEWVVRSACAQGQAWRAAGLPALSISVNVSARQFEEKRLVERVAQALRDTGLPPEALEVEVTESSIMRDLGRSVDKMRELKAMGISLSIDDFGTGYSSLSALKSFPISRLKIDKSFVSDLADSADDQAIAMAVISLGHKLNLRVIAEGVETEQQRAFLSANDCDEMQGYLFSPPVPAERIAAMLAQQPGAGELP
ncbi:bifunctional diguanylate cyclase/phosphodiesterase [Massilia yuzhufengensis]|uniref:PAS domain S-box-containing protein/diguanylate cyclase (GGDEF) domain-containing protein n=1 Tax=Massilia yuzhufengensis TaxID=1164594 RepID=A0A1I1F457_9BURK|nr:EAL domain-containing protein [Massilia yuzhufengensis]SFB91950.1 PAS domain S-box-containing protein/diguanylate cyclase (GGDEF) domain-containing protein [Massilia yuzhufengensis]